MAYLFKDSIKERVEESAIYVSDRVFNELDEVYRKAKAFDRIKIIHDNNVNEMSISDIKCIEMIGNELERADDGN